MHRASMLALTIEICIVGYLYLCINTMSCSVPNSLVPHALHNEKAATQTETFAITDTMTFIVFRVAVTWRRTVVCSCGVSPAVLDLG